MGSDYGAPTTWGFDPRRGAPAIEGLVSLKLINPASRGPASSQDRMRHTAGRRKCRQRLLYAVSGHSGVRFAYEPGTTYTAFEPGRFDSRLGPRSTLSNLRGPVRGLKQV